MPKYTITPDSNAVFVDKVAHTVDCSSLPGFIHAIQWYGEGKPQPYGEIEFAADDYGKRFPNLKFTDFGPFQYLVDAWHAVPAPGTRDPEEGTDAKTSG
jgi:hypothetical protein